MNNCIVSKKVLVIGGAGFIGSHIVEQLLAEDVAEVIIYDNFTRGDRDNLENALSDNRCTIFPLGGDIRDVDILDKAIECVDFVIHTAAMWLLHCHDFPASAFDVNIKGFFNVLEACRKHKTTKLVWSSSASVYGDAISTPMTEDHPYNNETFYGATKIADEHMAIAYYHRFGVRQVGLRYMNVYGPRQDYMGTYIAVIMKILDRIDDGLSPLIYGDGSQSYDFIHVEDIARANIAALKSDSENQFFNVGTGIGTSIKELTEIVLDILGSDLSIQYEAAGQTFVTNRIGDPKLLTEKTGFTSNIELRKGLETLILWRREHKDALLKRQNRVLE